MTSIALAVLFVSLAIIMNTAIYTENLATRGSDTVGSQDANRLRDAAKLGTSPVLSSVNENDATTHAALTANLSDGVQNWSSLSSKLYVASGSGAHVSLNQTTNGTRIEQDNATRQFTNESGNATDWTLVADVENTREFRMHIPSDLLEDLLNNGFKVIVDDGADKWNMTVTKDVTAITEINVTVSHPAGGGSCTRETDQAWINITDGTFNGTDCDALELGKGISKPYSIEYVNGDNVNGTYHLIVDNETLAENPSPNFNDVSSGTSPYVAPAIYSAQLDVHYETPRLYYNTSVRLAPGEPD